MPVLTVWYVCLLSIWQIAHFPSTFLPHSPSTFVPPTPTLPSSHTEGSGRGEREAIAAGSRQRQLLLRVLGPGSLRVVKVWSITVKQCHDSHPALSDKHCLSTYNTSLLAVSDTLSINTQHNTDNALHLLHPVQG